MSHITSCSFCGSILKDVLSLGMHPHSDLFPKDCDSTLEVYPLNLTRCTACGLYQTDFHLSTSKMFNDDYLYDNSVNLSSRRHWTSLANDLYNRISKVSNKSSNFAALDIGSNAGELLFQLEEAGFYAEGIEPSSHPHSIACSRVCLLFIRFKIMLFPA